MHASVILVEVLKSKCRKVMTLATVFAIGMTASAYAESVQEALNRLYPGWTASDMLVASTAVEGNVICTHPLDRSTPAKLTYTGQITGVDPVLSLIVSSHVVNGIAYDWVFNLRINGELVMGPTTINSAAPKAIEVPLAKWANQGEVTIVLENAAGGSKPWVCEQGHWHSIKFVDLSGDLYTLNEDEDWTGQEETKLKGTINLNGHNLTISRFAGFCTITETNSVGHLGELHVNVASGTVSGGAELTGLVTLVKEGEGTLTWDGGENEVSGTCPILVTNGIFKVGANVMFGGSGKITVKGKGQFDLNSGSVLTSSLIGWAFEIEGDGPDGTGAIISAATGTTGGCKLSTVVLTGDATIGGTVPIYFQPNKMPAYGVEGRDCVLTVKSVPAFQFGNGYAYLKVKRVVCDGSSIQPVSTSTYGFDEIPDGVFLKNGGNLKPYSFKSGYVLPLAVTVEDGETGSISCPGTGASSVKLTGAVTVGNGGSLTINDVLPITFTGDVVDNGTISASAAATITGTLRGGGAITGTGFTFGTGSCWLIDIDGSTIRKVVLENVAANALVNLGTIDISHDNASGYYDLAPAGDLGDEQLSQITLRVTNTKTGHVHKTSQLEIRDGRLGVLIPNGIVILFR